ncbi:uncharacterized protein I303_104476 [Kwoniella dejecticola CBS 10117]|uniref:Zn(2)-C6 fungal-type domain-containing protein n=1 Tax=Kwoniella dejecticola CBS 10117 TaxID=1296121 RepID=A0A1A6A595_9TREE|nr:uncharacterized protein I303_04546 [Kwoniella dejecticola CBS 10117]OBR85213.1 hypothetical protein I303_04546 [Kwoniella dejecticola CBS 10117]
MYTSTSSATARSEEEDQPEERRKIKRPRAKLTCLNCKRRKTKCDKTLPCSSCITRGEGGSCHYEEGYEPIQTHPSSSNQEFKAIQDRLERIEAALTTHTLHSHLSPAATAQSKLTNGRSENDTSVRAATEERAHGVLVASRTKPNHGPSPIYQNHYEQETIQSRTTAPEIWPNIVLTSTYRRSARWHREMHSILETLPNQAQMDYILDFYFLELQIIGMHIMRSVFMSEMDRFVQLKSLNLQSSVDPAWLAQVVCILWVTCHFLAENDTRLNSSAAISIGLTKASTVDLAFRLYDALEMALNCAGWLFRPQIRVLQTLLVAIYLNMQGCYHTGRLYGPPPDWSCCLWFDIAVGICKGLELHLDPSIAEIVKMQDPALPPSRPVYSAQVIRRAFHDLLLFDTYTIINSSDITRTLFPYSFPDDSFLTPPPVNYSEESLTSEALPCSRTDKTDFIWTLHQNLISQEWRKIVNVLEKLDDVPYSMVMERSQVLRDGFTDFLALKADDGLNQYETDAFALTYSSYQQRFLRLHRPFFIRGYQDHRYEHSRITVIAAARQIAKTHRRLLLDSSGHSIVKSAVFMFQHHITALPILLLNALYDRSSAHQMRQELSESSAAFLKSYQSNFPLHIHVSAKGVCIANEMIKVIDNPPASFDNIEEILQDVNTKAKETENVMLGRPVPQQVDASDTGISQPFVREDGQNFGVMPSQTSIQPLGDFTLLPSAEQNWWDTDWTMFLRDI